MKRMQGNERVFWTIIVGIVGIFGLITPIEAQVPRKMSHQGFLTTAEGVPISGTKAISFNIYDVPTGGIPLWTETQDVAVTNGYYSVILGKMTPITLPWAETYYLGVLVAPDPEMTPRIELTIGPFVPLIPASEAPACDASYDGVVVLASDYRLCVCRDTVGWVSALDGLTACFTPQEDAIVYVAPDGSDEDVDGESCGSMTAPCRTVERGVEVANAASPSDMTVVVKSGTYNVNEGNGEYWLALGDQKNITLQGEPGATLNLGANGISIEVPESDRTVVVEGFTIDRTGDWVTTIGIGGTGTVYLTNNVITSSGKNTPVIWFYDGVYSGTDPFTGTAYLTGNTITTSGEPSNGISIGAGTVYMENNTINGPPSPGPYTEPPENPVAVGCNEELSLETLFGDGSNVAITGYIRGCGPSVPDCTAPPCIF